MRVAGEEQGGPWLRAAPMEPGAPDPGPGDARAGVKGRGHLRLRARVPRPQLFTQEGPRRGAWARATRPATRGAGPQEGRGIPDSRINVLKATTPSSP